MIRRLFLVLLLLTTMVAACGASPQPRMRLTWSDEFNGPAGALPDTASWGFQVGGDGWGNNELECYTDAPGNVSTDGAGHLVVTAIRQPGHVCSDGKVNDWTSSRITTQHKVSAKRGRLVVRAKVPSGVGTWSAFWAMGTDHDTVGWPASGEIDVMEQVGREPRQVLGTVHGPRTDGSRWYLTRHHTAKKALASEFHTYAVTWTRSSMTWSLDGKTYGRVTKAQARKQGRWVFDKPFYLLLNQAIGGNLGGGVPASTADTQSLVVDYVRIYS